MHLIDLKPKDPTESISKKKEMIDIFSKVIPAFTGVFILLEALTLILYYDRFNLPIINYFSISFILSYFIGSVANLIKFSLILAVIAAALTVIIVFFLASKKKKSNADDIKETFNMMFTFTLVMVIGITVMSYYIDNIKIGIFYDGILSGIVNISFVVLVLGSGFTNFWLLKSFHSNYNLKTFFVCAFAYIFFTYGMDNKKINQLKAYPESRKVCVITKEETIPAQGSRYYIGNTSDYYFIYDSLQKSVRVIKTEDIKEVIYYK